MSFHRVLTFRICASFTIMLIALLRPAHGAEWFESDGISCSGLKPVTDAFQVIAPISLNVQKGTGPEGYFVVLKAEEFNALRDKTEESTSTRVLLSPGQASELRAVIKPASANAKVPMFISIGTSILTGISLPAKIGTLDGVLFTFLFDNLNARATTTAMIEGFVAAGGEAYNRQVILKREGDQARFLSQTVEYKVSVARETRSFIIGGCIYPIKIGVSEFNTADSPLNNKIIRMLTGNEWKIWDVDGARYEGEPLTYVRQEGEYYYFERVVINEGQIVGKDDIRVSFAGGSWQRHRYDSPVGEFRTIYAKMLAR